MTQSSIRRIQNASYAVSKKIYSKNILEDDKCGPYSKETLIHTVYLYSTDLNGVFSQLNTAYWSSDTVATTTRMTRISSKQLITPYEKPEQKF
ncbi:hypothetical protein Tco_0890947 [Tanacetum coccineum]|uniref:Uncharacterized protein n=1 Tax=Tanacetum coccineum TaxID=301880 RepID=A0ABQ5C1I0_9ASTR